MISFWYALRFLRCQTNLLGGMLILLLLSALMFVSHALTGVFGIAGCCLLALTERDVPLSMRGLLIVMLSAGALLAADEFETTASLIVVDDVDVAYAKVAMHFHPLPLAREHNVHPTAFVHPDAELEEPVEVGPNASVGSWRGARRQASGCFGADR